MNLACCEHPKRIFNRSLKEWITVPCGHCNTCRNRKANEWIQRLDVEMQCWKYCVFFTLTYDDEHIPEFVLTRKKMLYDFDNDFCVDLQDSNLDGRSLAYIQRRKTLNHLFKPDVQKFIKRIRYYNSTFNHSYEKNILRYFVVGEYGPTTLRAHYHGLFFFSSDETAKNFPKMLSKSWTYGRTDWSFVRSNAASYVASYVNCFSHLPKVYLHPEFRPFCLCSKHPSIGSLHILEEEIFKIFDNGFTQRTEFSRRKQEYVYVPLLRSTKDTLFPKVQGYSNLSHLDRVALYSIARFSEAEDFEGFVNYVLDLTSDVELISPWMIKLNELVSSPTLFPLYNLWCVSCRVLHQAAVFDCTMDYYVSRIEKFYQNVELKKLKNQYQFEEEYCKRYHPSGLINYYTEFIPTMLNNLKDCPIDDKLSVVRFYRSALDSFCVDLDKFMYDMDYRHSLCLENQQEYQLMCSQHAAIYRKSSKTKVKNDYLRSHPEARILTFN